MVGYLVTWNDVPSSDIPEFVCQFIERDLLGEYRGSQVYIPGRSGAYHFDEQPGDREITLTCYLLAEGQPFPSGRRSAVTRTANWLDVGTQARLILGDDPDVFYNAVLIDTTPTKEWRDLALFDLVFSAEPYAYDLNATAYETTQSTDTEWTYDFGLLADLYPVIEITNTEVTPVNSVEFTINGVGVRYDNPLAAGATITINSIGMAVLAGVNTDTMLTGAYNPADSVLQYVLGEGFPMLHQGVNELFIGSSSTADFDIRITYRKRYRN